MRHFSAVPESKSGIKLRRELNCETFEQTPSSNQKTEEISGLTGKVQWKKSWQMVFIIPDFQMEYPME